MKDKRIVGIQRSQQVPNVANQGRLPWSALEQQVVRMQKQISEACVHGDRQAIHDLQQRLMESEAARLLAVRRVTEENAGKNTAGVDGVKSLSLKERLEMASVIHPRNWNQQPARPVRRVWIPKPGTSERRPLAILSMIDRCKQALVKLALEPEWEMRFEPHSYGYRPGRGAHDAIAAILVAMKRHPLFVFDADIEGAFDHVNQGVVLDKLQTFPALRQAINGWLKAGVMEGSTYFPSEMGIAQGGVLSPLLMNVALHGMEGVVMEGADTSRGREQPLLVRYADDFVILHTDLNKLKQVVKRVREWLATMGLHFNAEKTRITHTLTPYQREAGFDFLGFHIRQEAQGEGSGRHPQGAAAQPPAAPASTGGEKYSLRVKTIVIPSQEASRRHLEVIEQRLRGLQMAPQAQVIAELNPLIVGWVAYYNGVVPEAIISRYDDLMEQRLLNWASKRHAGKGRDWLIARYWHAAGKNRRVFATPDGVQLRLYRQASIL